MMTWYSGTDLDFDEDTIEGLYAAYLECTQWLHRGHNMEPSVNGRKITQGEYAAYLECTQWFHRRHIMEPSVNGRKITQGEYAAYLECTQWLHRGHIMEPSVNGRKITQGEYAAYLECTQWFHRGHIMEPSVNGRKITQGEYAAYLECTQWFHRRHIMEPSVNGRKITQGEYAAYLECTQWLHRGHIMEPSVNGRKITQGEYAAYLECTQWLHRGHIMEPSVNGRKITQGEYAAYLECTQWFHRRHIMEPSVNGRKITQGEYAAYLECTQWFHRGHIMEPSVNGRKITQGEYAAYLECTQWFHRRHIMEPSVNGRKITQGEYAAYLECTQWLHRGDIMEPSVNGRKITQGEYAAYLECTQWLHRGHIMEPSVNGRKITQGDMITHYAADGAIHDTGLNLQQIGRHLQDIEAALHRYDNVLPDPEFALIGHRHFFNSDLTIHQRREFYASVRLLSNRTMRPETYTSGPNADGFFQADGFMSILVDGGEYGERNNEIFQVYDWARIPSVTNQYTTDIPRFQSGNYYAKRFYNDARFVGGVTNDYIGLASMVYNRPYVPLTALKSWFFFDVIVVVGSNINLPQENVTSESVITTLTQITFDGEYVVCTQIGEELIPEMGNQSFVNPMWLYHRNVSYVFLEGGEHLFTSSETRSHDNKDLEAFTAWLDLTPSPKDATLAYAILPATSVEATRDFVNNPSVEVLSRSSSMHVVCHHPTITIGASLIEGGQSTALYCGGVGPLEIVTDIPCLVLIVINDYSPDTTEIALSISEPTHDYDQVNIAITLDGRQVEQLIDLPLDPVRG
ncbi:hypothetical protein SK128_016973, partial [Halocaridina rubra]